MERTGTVDREGLEVLSLDECLELIARAPVGRVAFVAGGQPLILPVNHGLDGHDIVFRSAYGTKLHAAAHGAAFAFEVDGGSPYGHYGWSVVVQGTAEEVLDDGEIERFRSLDITPWADAVPREGWIRIRADEISGRRIPRPGRML